jgi:hydrogenase maturation protease
VCPVDPAPLLNACPGHNPCSADPVPELSISSGGATATAAPGVAAGVGRLTPSHDPGPQAQPPCGRALVLGIGNLLNRDEGVGVRLLEMLARRIGACELLTFVDGGVMGLELLPYVESCERLLVLDAVDAAAQPGTVVELRDEQVRRFAGGTVSVHEMTFHDVLALAQIRGTTPLELRVVGVQPGDTTLGTELSADVAAALEPAIAAATRVLVEWGVAA